MLDSVSPGPLRPLQAFRYQRVLWPMPVACSCIDLAERRPPVEREERVMPLWLVVGDSYTHKEVLTELTECFKVRFSRWKLLVGSQNINCFFYFVSLYISFQHCKPGEPGSVY